MTQSSSTTSPSVRGLNAALSVTIFVSAFLLFQIQPMYARVILPWFGGTPAVWSTCLLFFQLLLLAGYIYSHLLFSTLAPRRQGLVHILLITAVVALLGIEPDSIWKPSGDEPPVLYIAALLLLHIGLPYFLLATTAPLIQGWFSLNAPQSSPYRLYALSNIGSLLALLSYPFAVEPLIGTHAQLKLWMVCYVGYAVLLGLCCLGVRYLDRVPSPSEETATVDAEHPSAGTQLMWLGLSACGVVLLLAVTNHVCHDVATVPFLWVVPLSLYLLSFIACFDSDAWYWRVPYTVAALLLSLVFVEGTFVSSDIHLFVIVPVSFLMLFCCCMVCHGELVRLKPTPRHLTRFYLTMSAGGAVGGLFVALGAPYLFNSYLELDIGIVCMLGLVLLVHYQDKGSRLYGGEPKKVWRYLIISFVGLIAALSSKNILSGLSVLEQTRNFYGVLRVKHEHPNDVEKERITLVHGRIVHGSQYVDPKKRMMPTEYFNIETGIGTLFRVFPKRQGRRIGIIGLGAGTIAAYGAPNDLIRYYEINPEVEVVAREHFSYLSASRAEIKIVLGDARLSMEREAPQEYDILILDAFSSDAIPVHLLTQEAFDLYVKHLANGGVIAAHLSNRHLDLRPIVMGLAEQHGFTVRLFGWEEQRRRVQADWMILTKNPAVSHHPFVQQRAFDYRMPKSAPRIWTDDFSNLVEILK